MKNVCNIINIDKDTTSSIDKIAIGKRIKTARESRNITQEYLATMVGCTPTHISVLERGVKTPRLDTLIKITNILNVSADSILNDNALYTTDICTKEFAFIVNHLSEDSKKLIMQVVQILALKLE